MQKILSVCRRLFVKKIFVVFLMFFINLSADIRYLATHYGRDFCDTLGDTSMRSKACASQKIFMPEQPANSSAIDRQVNSVSAPNNVQYQSQLQPVMQSNPEVKYSYPVYNHYAYDRNYFDARAHGWLMGGGGVIDYNDPTLSDIVGAGMRSEE